MMLKNFLKITLRSFKRNPGYTGINIVGMAMGISCCILALLFLHNELTYDQFHKNADDIYRVTARFNRTIQFIHVPDPLVPAAVEEFSDVINGTRVWGSSVVVRHGSTLTEESVNFVDAAFFEVFSIPMRAGASTFSTPNDVVLTPALAQKYFGHLDPVGQTLEMRLNDKFALFTVIGVAEDLPENSSLFFDMLLPFELRYEIREPAMKTEWESYGVVGFIQTKPDADTARVSRQLLSLVEKHHGVSIREDGGKIEDYAYLISPFINHHLGGGGTGSYGLKAGTDPTYVYLLAIIAGLVLLIACFNFMNLSIGQASGRLKEIGVRKVVGAERKQLLFQFGFEAIVMSVFAALVSVMLVYNILPFFNNLTDTQLVFQPFIQPVIPVLLVIITIVTAIIAGFYPAFILSGIKSITAFKGKYRIGGANLFTQTLVVLQFSCTIAFMIGTVFITRQHAYMQRANLGFEKEQVVMIPVSAPENQPDAGEILLARFQEELKGHPDILTIAGASDVFMQGNSATMKTLEDGRQEILFTYRIDDNFIDALDLEVLDGRMFNPELQSDAQSGIIINEAFAKVFNMDQPVGQVVPVELVGIAQPMIIGVVKDFHFQSLHSQIKPVFFHQQKPYKINYLAAKISPESAPESIKSLQNTWSKLQPEYPFEYQFLDEVVDSQYRAEARWSSAMQYASWVAILIACLGLLGLTSITMSRRTKEVGIRKVLGASVPGLVGLLSKEFVLMVALANFIAWPVAYWAIGRWLEGFSYHIEMGAGVFVWAGLLALSIALLTISYQSIKTATSNPVKSLKYE